MHTLFSVSGSTVIVFVRPERPAGGCELRRFIGTIVIKGRWFFLESLNAGHRAQHRQLVLEVGYHTLLDCVAIAHKTALKDVVIG